MNTVTPEVAGKKTTKGEPGQSPLLQLKAVSFRWQKTTPVILQLDRLEVGVGEHIFIKGPSGSGKSTLLNLIAGVVTPQRGLVCINDHAVSELGSAKRDIFRANNIGFIFQMFNLVPYLSVIENVTLPLLFSSQRRERVQAQGQPALEAARLLERLALPATLLKRPVRELSIGQQQRVAAARAMIGSPPLLIADEPTSALDHDTREAFIRLLFEECARTAMTLLFVSHDGSLETLFDRSLALLDINKADGGKA